MAECAVARCVQERRSFKKELQKWGKNVLFLAGLERVAEELVGREKWKRHMTPITDIDKKVIVDWEPDDLCCFCNGQKQPAPDPAKGVCTIDGLPLYNGATESDGNLSEDARLTPSPPPDQPLDLSMGSKTLVAYLSPHSPSADSGDTSSTVLKVPQVPLKPGMKKRFDTAGCKRSYTDDELQAALRDIQSGKLGTRRAAVIYGIPRSTLRNKVYKLALERDGGDGSRHSRSKAAAAAALSVEELVCSNGGLEATKSASESLRQLLRNRMAERVPGSKVATEGTEHIDNTPSSSTSSSLPFFSPLEYGQALAPLLSQVLANVNELALSKLRGSGGAISPEEAAASLSELPDECRLPFLSDLIRRLAEERLEEKRTHNGPKTSSTSLNGVNCGAVEDLSVTGSCSSSSASTNNSSSSPQNNVILKIPSYKPMKSLSNSSSGVSSETTLGVSGGNVSGVTSQNSSGGTKLAGRGIGVSLREIIAKSITQRVTTTPTAKSKLDNKDLCNGSSDSSNQGFEEPLAKKPKTCSSVSGSGKSCITEKGVSAENGGNMDKDKVTSAGPTGAGGGGAGETGQQHHKPEKRTRPKRGRYRNYDRDNLAEAVRAVQRGEMSVHRAGSYYGVPHSTLEYKVKERHLLRPRKRDAKKQGNNSNSSGLTAAAPAAAIAETSGKIPPSQHSNSSTNSSSGASSQNGIKMGAVSVTNNDAKGFTGVGVTFPSHLPLWQSSPFFSLDFSQFSPNHFFASQMMRKLQEDALMHAEATSCTPGSSNNKADSVSLLSSIIRSGLQAQVHAEAAISKAASRVAKDATTAAATSSFSSSAVAGTHKVQDSDIPLNLSEAKVE